MSCLSLPLYGLENLRDIKELHEINTFHEGNFFTSGKCFSMLMFLSPNNHKI